MTEFEDMADHFADEDGPRVRELFARTAVQAHPRLAFTAEDLVLGGRRRVRRRRVAAIVGSTASVAVVAVAATAFAGGGGSGPAAVAPGASPVRTSPRPALTTTSTAKPPLTDDGAQTAAEKDLAKAVFTDMFGKLDPGSKHITRYTSPGGAFAVNDGICEEKTGIWKAYGIDVDWTADGKDPFPRSTDDKTPYTEVSAVIYAPGENLNQFRPSDGWGPLTRSTLPDGSVVQAGSTDHGRWVQVVRTMKNGQQIMFRALDGSRTQGGARPTDPFPFTAAQLGAIVSGESLPLPFADGFQPHSTCGP